MLSIRSRQSSSTMRQTSIQKSQGATQKTNVISFLIPAFILPNYALICSILSLLYPLTTFSLFTSPNCIHFSPCWYRLILSCQSLNSFFLFHLSSFFFNVSLTHVRVEFEAACEDLFERLTAPIDAALKMAGKTLSEVHSVELLGEQ